MDNQPVSFPEWKQALATAGLSAAAEEAYRREIISFLKHCKTQHVPATVMLAKQYVEQQERLRAGPVRVALRWFFRTANAAKYNQTEERGQLAKEGEQKSTNARERADPQTTREEADQRVLRADRRDAARSAGSRSTGSGSATGQATPPYSGLRPMEPRPARDDPGGPEWERALIKTMRLRGLLWRTEESYRSWARRFAHFIAPRSPYAASGVEVQAFLTDLAVQGRASASGQRQALCALVFLMQEALSRDLGEMDFKRATPRVRVPVFLTEAECRRLFAQMTGTHRLMAELAYGSGIRLMELLRLLVHHLDLERRQLHVKGGKGDKDRVEAYAHAA